MRHERIFMTHTHYWLWVSASWTAGDRQALVQGGGRGPAGFSPPLGGDDAVAAQPGMTIAPPPFAEALPCNRTITYTHIKHTF